MDDVPGGCNSVDDGVDILTQIKGFFGSMHMKVHKINSNNKELLSMIEGTDDSEEAAVLGLQWHTNHDSLCVPNKEWDKTPTTKREFLQKNRLLLGPYWWQEPSYLQREDDNAEDMATRF